MPVHSHCHTSTAEVFIYWQRMKADCFFATLSDSDFASSMKVAHATDFRQAFEEATFESLTTQRALVITGPIF